MAVRGTNRVRQRLIAAGASPDKATQFIQQLAQRTQSSEADLEDIFDAELGAFAKQKFPSLFRPPTPDDPEFDDYLEFVKGPSARQRVTQTISKATPNILGIYQTMLNKGYLEADGATVKQESLDVLSLPEYIVKRLYLDRDITPLQLKNEFKTATNVPAQALVDYQKAYADPADFNSVIDTIDKETTAGEKAAQEVRQGFYDADKVWKSGVPDSKLKFGSTTNLKQGIVSYRTVPGVEQYFSEANRVARERFPGSSAAAGIAVPGVEKKVLDSKLTPFVLEGKTRQSLKGQRIK